MTVKAAAAAFSFYKLTGRFLDSLSLEELEKYRAELEARLCGMDNDEPEDMAVAAQDLVSFFPDWSESLL